MIRQQFTCNLKANQIHTLSFIAKWLEKKKKNSPCPKTDFPFGAFIGF